MNIWRQSAEDRRIQWRPARRRCDLDEPTRGIDVGARPDPSLMSQLPNKAWHCDDLL